MILGYKLAFLYIFKTSDSSVISCSVFPYLGSLMLIYIKEELKVAFLSRYERLSGGNLNRCIIHPVVDHPYQFFGLDADNDLVCSKLSDKLGDDICLILGICKCKSCAHPVFGYLNLYLLFGNFRTPSSPSFLRLFHSRCGLYILAVGIGISYLCPQLRQLFRCKLFYLFHFPKTFV